MVAEVTSYAHFDAIPRGRYDLIMADPPWLFRPRKEVDGGHKKSPQHHYRCESLDDLKRWPVADLAKKDCLLWLWATNPMLDQAFDLLRAWGFEFKTAGHWGKITSGGKPAFSTGYLLRGSGEPFLFGVRGAPKTTRTVRSMIYGPVREHSRKPDEAFEAAEQLMPGATRIELFSREDRPGWDHFGDEVGLFNRRRQLEELLS